jgi:hypothetical protein
MFATPNHAQSNGFKLVNSFTELCQKIALLTHVIFVLPALVLSENIPLSGIFGK